MPQEGELLGRVIKLVGAQDVDQGQRSGADSAGDFKSDRADIIWRYISAHAEKMKPDGLLQGLD